jgi:hypothetical protein
MAPKSAAALVLLAAAMIAGLAPPLQAQVDIDDADRFVSRVDRLCFGAQGIQSCARQLVESGGATIPLDCCRALVRKFSAPSIESKWCACGFVQAATNDLRVAVDQRCQQATNDGGVAGGVLKLEKFCDRAAGTG